MTAGLNSIRHRSFFCGSSFINLLYEDKYSADDASEEMGIGLFVVALTGDAGEI